MLSKAFIPYKGYYSTPFCRWQSSMANENSIVLGAETSKRWLAEKEWDPKMFDYIILGVTIGQPKQFYAGPWSAALIGAVDTPGCMSARRVPLPPSAFTRLPWRLKPAFVKMPIPFLPTDAQTDRIPSGLIRWVQVPR